MQNLTKGSIAGHLLRTTGVMLVTMVFQTLYFLVDLDWVGHLGKEAVAGEPVALPTPEVRSVDQQPEGR